MNLLRRACAALATVFWAAASLAATSFQIETIYSSADGAVQFVVLHETSGLDGQQALSGSSLSIQYGAHGKLFTLPNDLPGSDTAGRRVLIASQGLADLGIITPDYVFPNQFLATGPATLTFSGADSVAYAALPTDGVSAITRDGVVVADVATNFAGDSVAIPPVPVTVVEYYDAARDHYFMSALQPDIDALDRQIIPGWQRTGQTFAAYATADSGGPGAQPVCRFYIPPQNGDSHFFSASLAECAAILGLMQTNPAYAGYVYETPSAFYIALPDLATGACPVATVPVYRLWNQRIDSNHRYTSDPAIKAQMIAQGFAPEGYGPDAVAMCAPATGPVDLTNVGFNGVAWTGTLFVAVAGGFNGVGLIAISRDGLQWSVRSSGTPSLRGITWTGSQLIAVGTQGTIITSPDGYRWTARLSNATETLNAVAGSVSNAGTVIMAVGSAGVLLSSPDGVTWTRKVSKTSENINGIAWNGAKFVIVGDNGTILTVLATGVPPNTQFSGTAMNLEAIAVGASGKIVVVGANGTILTSTDAVNWNPRVSNTSASLQAVAPAGSAVGNIQFIAVGSNGRIVTSNNGNSWSIAQSRTSANLAGIAWSGARFVAVGSGGTIDTSPDGVTWTVE
jgi:photosystem II stability/assembly factor-like uncharacterized protein